MHLVQPLTFSHPASPSCAPAALSRVKKCVENTCVSLVTPTNVQILFVTTSCPVILVRPSSLLNSSATHKFICHAHFRRSTYNCFSLYIHIDINIYIYIYTNVYIVNMSFVWLIYIIYIYIYIYIHTYMKYTLLSPYLSLSRSFSLSLYIHKY